LDGKSLGLGVLRMLVSGYLVLAISMLAGALVSLTVVNDGLNQPQFSLIGLVIALIPQGALFAFVFTPIAMRANSKEWSFKKSLIILECYALISSIVTVGLLLVVVFYPEWVTRAFSRW